MTLAPVWTYVDITEQHAPETDQTGTSPRTATNNEIDIHFSQTTTRRTAEAYSSERTNPSEKAFQRYSSAATLTLDAFSGSLVTGARILRPRRDNGVSRGGKVLNVVLFAYSDQYWAHISPGFIHACS